MSSRKTLFTSGVTVIAAFTLSACASLPEPSTPMRLGESAAPPTAFLEFCERAPGECGDAPPEVVRTVARAELAQRNAAESRFAQGRNRNNLVATAAVQTEGMSWSQAFAEARRRREALSAPLETTSYDWSTVFATARSERSERSERDGSHALVLASTEPRDAKASSEAAPLKKTLVWSGKAEASLPPAPKLQPAAVQETPPPEMTTALWSTLNRVNDKLNRAIARKTDIANYGQVDFWTTPLADGVTSGDCEDYVLEKKRALIKAGVPADALSIAVVTTSWGEAHAVLLVNTDQGEYVLDNTTPWILPWRKANLRWHERQVAGSAFRWASVRQTLTFDVASQSLLAGGR